MIEFVQSSRGSQLPSADYVLDKTDKFLDIVQELTPKFEGRWSFVLLNPKLVFVKDIVTNNRVPDWVDVQIRVGSKKLEELCIEFPDKTPKQKTRKEEFDDLVATLNHPLDVAAVRRAYDAYKVDADSTVEALRRIDQELTTDTIGVKDLRDNIIVNDVLYASDVLCAFMTKDRYAWDKYYKLLTNVGRDVAYFAMRKYITRLLMAKHNYLQNKKSDLYVVSKIDAPMIAYTYLLFMRSNSPSQLYCILYWILNRSDTTLLKSED